MDIDAIIEKIKKAVRLANKTSEAGERETALRLAKGLAEKNGIAFEEVTSDLQETSKTIHDEETEYHTYEGVELGHVCAILYRHFGVVMMLHTAKGKSWKSRRSWFGSRLNIDIAKHVFHILMRESRRTYNKENKAMIDRSDVEKKRREMLEKFEKVGLPYFQRLNAVARLVPKNIDRKSFMSGFFFAIDQKLTQNPLRNDLDADRAAADKKLEEFRKRHQVRDSKSRKNNNPNADAIAAGFNAGSKMNLARPCEGGASSPLAIAM